MLTFAERPDRFLLPEIGEPQAHLQAFECLFETTAHFGHPQGGMLSPALGEVAHDIPVPGNS